MAENRMGPGVSKTMAQIDPLITLADRLRREEGESSAEYLSVLLRIKNKPRLWDKKYKTFKGFLEATGHGPYERFVRFEQTQAVLEAHDLSQIKKGDPRTRMTMKIVGFEAASQILNIEEAKRGKVIEALRQEAAAARHPLTYQAAVNTIYRVLKLPKQPSKTARGGVLKALREELNRLKEEKTRLKQIIAKLRNRLRDHGLPDTLPNVP